VHVVFVQFWPLFADLKVRIAASLVFVKCPRQARRAACTGGQAITPCSVLLNKLMLSLTVSRGAQLTRCNSLENVIRENTTGNRRLWNGWLIQRSAYLSRGGNDTSLPRGSLPFGKQSWPPMDLALGLALLLEGSTNQNTDLNEY